MGYTGVLVFEWDESKRSSNLRKHGWILRIAMQYLPGQ